jgi:hopanoid-associated phosphorylase
VTVLAVTGLAREASIIEGPGTRIVVGGADTQGLPDKLSRALGGGMSGIISIGIAGALSPTLTAGEIVVASHVIAGDEIFQADAGWSARLRALLPDAVFGAIAGVDAPVANAAAKAALNRANGSCAVDMESHVAARTAKAQGLPFAALRIISDTADQTLPHAALVAMKSDGGIDLAAVMRSLITRPGQILSLIRTARESDKAFAALLRCRNVLGPGLGCPYLG